MQRPPAIAVCASLFVFVNMLSISVLNAQTESDTLSQYDLLSKRHPYPAIANELLSRDAWHPFPTYQEREAWQQVPETLTRTYLQEAETALAEPWEILPASVFLEFAANGNRSRYQALRSSRRSALRSWVLAECLEGKGRFLEAIVNGIWAICEETYWGVPAHLYLQSEGIGLPDVEEPTVDLFAAETSALLSWTDYLLNEELDRFTPLLRRRIYYEINQKILEPLQTRDDFWWLGFSRDRYVNNWNPWIISNWLATVLLMEEDSLRRARHTHKALRSLDIFLNDYPSDGGCDEGPGYWGHAGASVFDCLEHLRSASDGAVDVYDEPLIRKMGSYIYKVFIDDHYFVNFADASATINLDGVLTYQYGKQIGDERMMQLGAARVRQIDISQQLPTQDRSLFRHLRTLFTYQEIAGYEAQFPYVRDAWFPELQVMTARSQAGTAEGFYLAAKGGHNAESHNHNDVGNFILYLDGEPVIIDVGVEEYTKKTFSDERYTIWTMQSAYHNVPTINGVMQQPGRTFAATEVRYTADDQEAALDMNINGAYPSASFVQDWRRSLRLDREEGMLLIDSFKVEKVTGEFFQTLMTAYTVSQNEAGKLLLRSRSSSSALLIQYDAEQFRLETEEIPITDERLKRSWSHPLIRLKFVAANPHTEDRWVFRMTRGELP